MQIFIVDCFLHYYTSHALSLCFSLYFRCTPIVHTSTFRFLLLFSVVSILCLNRFRVRIVFSLVHFDYRIFLTKCISFALCWWTKTPSKKLSDWVCLCGMNFLEMPINTWDLWFFSMLFSWRASSNRANENKRNVCGRERQSDRNNKNFSNKSLSTRWQYWTETHRHTLCVRYIGSNANNRNGQKCKRTIVSKF